MSRNVTVDSGAVMRAKRNEVPIQRQHNSGLMTEDDKSIIYNLSFTACPVCFLFVVWGHQLKLCTQRPLQIWLPHIKRTKDFANEKWLKKPKPALYNVFIHGEISFDNGLQ